MKSNQKTFHRLEQVREHILSGVPTLYTGSKTSTVLPFENLPSDLTLADLSCLPGKMSMDGPLLKIEGALSYHQVRSFCHQHGREFPFWPTDQDALVLSGIATSATGERSFSFGTMRKILKEVTYLNSLGNSVTLKNDEPLEQYFSSDLLGPYRESYQNFRHFKNGPFPCMEKATDLMVGTEGQLGIITAATFDTINLEPSEILSIALPSWIQDTSPHLEIFKIFQKHRDKVYGLEFIDSQALDFLEGDYRIQKAKDYLFLEVPTSQLERVMEIMTNEIQLTPMESILMMTSQEFHQIRVDVPRTINENNARKGQIKKGTDVQVAPENFPKLLEHYKEFAEEGIPFVLFGHFGDAHLHFNFLPDSKNVEKVEAILEDFYHKMKSLNASPFAEHGIGMIKQKYVQLFYQEVHRKLFKELKNQFDPHNIFFPNGYMSERS